MQPPSFDDFIRRHRSGSVAEKNEPQEPLALTTCPAPGCGSHSLMPHYDGGFVVGFTCANGCEFSVRRNVFTGDVMYYRLDSMPLSRDSKDICGMKFNALGEPYTDWY